MLYLLKTSILLIQGTLKYKSIIFNPPFTLKCHGFPIYYFLNFL